VSWLLLDAGNTALKWELTCPAGAQWRETDTPEAAAAHANRRGSIAMDDPQLAAKLLAELERAGTPTDAATTAIVGCAVASEERVDTIDAAIRAASSQKVQWLGAAAQFDHDGITLRNSYRNPLQLGPDRWHALIGARARFPQGVLAVINAGTATTVDGLNEDGHFVGGVIAPGIDLMRTSLAQGTARLPLAAGEYVAHPDNSDDAICTGILDAQIGLIERRVRRIREQAGGLVHVVLSGGRGPDLFALLRAQAGFGTMIAHEPDLVLRGLWHRARALASDAVTNRVL